MFRADEGIGFLLRYENIAWYEDGKVDILDRRIYPVKKVSVTCTRHEEVAKAIADMVTQSGGPYTAAAMGMALAAYEAKDKTGDEYVRYMEDAAYTLSHARPTTVKKMELVVERQLKRLHKELDNGTSAADIPEKLKEEAINRLNENYQAYDKVATYLADQIPHNGTIMTQCFAETIIGTLLRECRRRGNEIKVVCPETRPYYQGARLTASVAYDMGFDTTIVTDNMPAYVMHEKKVDVFTSAADVITMDGHVVNKVGTFQIALAARYWGIPYFTTGTPSKGHPNMDNVEIELRDPELVLESMGQKHVLEGIKGFYPAFDVTPPKLIDGIVTPKGIYSPYNLKNYYDDEGENDHV
ncbi:MAG: s-methyl-5-thioribose-1-phosphate isomerase [Erysipelotrichaceae bacterium]|nr:s-methyl-5-thioribose-1-phosphate isomerase [Erysipelotrichaceae bacterium]MBR3227946.1 s-methyl-5-thioribose-1-phosphate isomerase [Erysipelotrichaceae bacterium]